MNTNEFYLTQEQLREVRKVRQWYADFRMNQVKRKIQQIHQNYAQELIDGVENDQ